MNHTPPKQVLLEITQSFSTLLDQAVKEIPTASDNPFADWQQTIERCQLRLDDDLFRMGVVGTIKSGKSTFINSLFSGDFLKRGAGVITSIVTKVRRSHQLKAVMTFKSWPEINEEISQALSLFGSMSWRSESESPFDIRRTPDREDLFKAIDKLESKHLLSRDTRSVSSVLLNAYLRGFQKVSEIVSEQTETIVYSGNRFYEHQKFSGNEDLAVYLKDLNLEIDSGDLDENIEIADCQGSDSPNPLHLAMIQDYLRTSDLIIYVISSRTGIRQADINFMTMIKQMGGMGNVLFVVNFDFNEHEGLPDLQRVTGKIAEDLSLMTESPAIYTFSALYGLFQANGDILSDKDAQRFAQWEADAALAEFSGLEKSRFERDFRYLITEQRYSLLLKNLVHRLQTMNADFLRWLGLNREILSSDATSAGALMKRIKQQQKKTEKVKSMIRSTIDGATQQLKKEIRAETDRFFDFRHGDPLPGIIDFIRTYSVPYEQYRQQLVEDGFAEVLFSVFQHFKEHLDRYMAETVNPKLFGFIRERENYIAEYFESITRPYETMVRDALAEYQGSANVEMAQRSAAAESSKTEAIAVDAVKKNHGLKLPEAAATLDYTKGIKSEAFVKLGFYRVVDGVKRLIKRKVADGSADIAALKSGVARMKKETESNILFHFKNYRENIKFQYLFRLIEAVAGERNESLINRFQAYATDLSQIKSMINQNQTNKESALTAIDAMISRVEATDGRLEELKQSI